MGNNRSGPDVLTVQYTHCVLIDRLKKKTDICMKINPSSSVLNTPSFFASLTKTTLYFSVGKQSEVNFGGGGLTNVRILNSMERWRMRCKPCRCYISKYSKACLIRCALGIKCRNTQGIRFHSVKHIHV